MIRLMLGLALTLALIGCSQEDAAKKSAAPGDATAGKLVMSP